MYSVRRRLMLVLAAGFAALILGTGAWVADMVNDRARADFDAALLAQLRALVSLTDQEDGQIEFDYAPQYMPEFERPERPEYFQFWLDDGRVLLRSTRLEGDLPRVPSAPGEPLLTDAELPDGRAGRVVQLAYVPRGPGDQSLDAGGDEGRTAAAAGVEVRGLVLAVARGRDRLDAQLASTWALVLGAGALAIALAVLLVWRALARGFRPIHAVAAQVGGLDADALSARVALPRTPRELAPIVDQLNALLARLDAAFERERRFTGNVAHELRTPIAELRSLAMVGARWPDDEVSITAFFTDVRDVAERMEGVIADLLLLARCQAGVERAERRPVDLRRLIESAWSGAEARAAASGLRFELELPGQAVVETDPGKLSIVLANLLGNAVSHARPRTAVRCTAVRRGAALELEIDNAAAPLAPEELGRLTEPFWRADAARSSSEHAGLGLALVAALAELLGLAVRFGQDPDGTFRVRLAGLVALAPPRPQNGSAASDEFPSPVAEVGPELPSPGDQS